MKKIAPHLRTRKLRKKSLFSETKSHEIKRFAGSTLVEIVSRSGAAGRFEIVRPRSGLSKMFFETYGPASIRPLMREKKKAVSEAQEKYVEEQRTNSSDETYEICKAAADDVFARFDWALTELAK